MQPNPSIAQARAMVDEFYRHGVVLAVISPGSRSASLAIAFEEHEGIATRVILDERSRRISCARPRKGDRKSGRVRCNVRNSRSQLSFRPLSKPAKTWFR